MVHQDPDIMIIDEGLSVGDKTFVDKSKKKMFEFRDQGKTILMVSHDMRTVKEWNDRVIWLNYGEVKPDLTTLLRNKKKKLSVKVLLQVYLQA